VGRRGRGSWVEGGRGVCVYEVMVVREGRLYFSSRRESGVLLFFGFVASDRFLFLFLASFYLSILIEKWYCSIL
jgi:hypothetical protein